MARIEPFDKYSDEYDRWFEEHEEIYESEVALMRLLLPGLGTSCFEITEIKQTLLPGEPAGKTLRSRFRSNPG